nr:polysaccharide pyruvyl transferase family protein [Auraticoccus cholistanensis]
MRRSSWTALGELQTTVTVRTAETVGASAVCELRARDGLGLSAFTLTRDPAGRSGPTAVDLVGTATGPVLDALGPGRHDLSLVVQVGGRRRHLRVAVEEGTELPPSWNGLEVYATRHGNLSWHRSTEKPFTYRVVPSAVPVGLDSAVVDPAVVDVAARVVRQVLLTDVLGPCQPAHWFGGPRRVGFDRLLTGRDVLIGVTLDDDGWEVSAVGCGRPTATLLRNVLVNQARMVADAGQERHVLGRLPRDLPASAVAERVVATVGLLRDRIRRFLEAGEDPAAAGLVPAYWWDAKANFGDVLGPMLIDYITGRPAINVRSFPSHDPGLFTVGSVAAHLTRPGARIWGSGVIGTLPAKKLAELAEVPPAAITAVRGALTRQQLVEGLGWQVPEVYGDPALLLPRWYTPRPAPESAGKVVVVPHYMHKHLFDRFEADDVFVLDVQQGPEVVVDQIAAARAVISSSLHGLVVAQAYGVPSTWLRVGDVRLHGDRFKFEDYFTVVEREEVSELDLGVEDVADVDWVRVAAGARLPGSRFDADRLLDAFPHV